MTLKRFKRILRRAGVYFVASLALSVLYYVLLSAVYDTPEEKRLRAENELYEEILPESERVAALLEEEGGCLRQRDRNIYKSVFSTDAPGYGGVDYDIVREGERDEGDIMTSMYVRSSIAVHHAAEVEASFREIQNKLSSRGLNPPMLSPVENLDYTKVGASTGRKLNPFYKVPAFHDGLDIVAPEGTPVCATGKGQVTLVKKSETGEGNVIEINHGRGYVTRYAHLGEIKVKPNSHVRAGEVIGTVGDSGRSFTTHLHYSVRLHGNVMNPVDYLWGDVNPDHYWEMSVMSTLSGQSLD